MKKLFFVIFCCCVCISVVFAQTAEKSKSEYVFKQQYSPRGMDNHLFVIYYYNGKAVYNLRSKAIATLDGVVRDLKVNPSGTSFGVLYQTKDKAVVEVWENDDYYRFKDVENPTALCYTPDAKKLLIATPRELLFYEPRKKYELKDMMPMPFSATKMLVSGNGYYLAATDGRQLIVWNLEQKRIRKEFSFSSRVNDIAFSDDNSTFAVLTADGALSLFNTRTFLCQQHLSAMGNAKSCAFHPEGKYVSVISGDTRITTINLYNEKERAFLDNADGGIVDLFYTIDSQERIALSYNTRGSISAKVMGGLAPNYTKLLADELDERMNEWVKMMPDETLDEYKLRVNDETRVAQMRLYEEEIATRMADNTLEMAQITLGSYNTADNVLAVDFDNMPTIYLPVPSEDVNDFKRAEDLEFRDTKYGLTTEDNFELVYADVLNTINQKSYVFDNRERETLDYLQSEESFVPLELIQQSNMETMKLQEIKADVVSLAKQENTISDHTNIAVNAEVVSSEDADGNGIMNYKIDFEYEVEPQFSVHEDFAPGKYRVEESGAAMAMLAIVKEAFEQDFAQYVQAGKKLQVNIKGTADALAISGKIPYNGCYGNFEGEPIYKNNALSNITVTKASGITQNEQLAFLRAMGVQNFIQQNIPALSEMNTDYRNYIEVTEGKGGAYRRITIEFIFVDAF